MKRIIEIEENDYELSKADKIPSMGFECRRILIAVRDSKPYEEPRDNFDLGYVKGLEDARPQGEWIKNEHTFWTCSHCNWFNEMNRIKYNFCPNCGADMRKGGTE